MWLLSSKPSAALGIAAIVILVGKAVSTSEVSTTQVSTTEEDYLREGFAEASGQWSSFRSEWRDSTPATVHRWIRRIPILHFTDDEFIELYRWRATALRLADDPLLSVPCAPDGVAHPFSDLAFSDLMPESYYRALGRGFARHHLGRPRWRPPVDLLTNDDVWLAFDEYLRANDDMVDALEVWTDLGDGLAVPDNRQCIMEVQLIRAAAYRPDDGVGGVRLIDLMRAMELYDIEKMW
jgi:hypothetical protein